MINVPSVHAGTIVSLGQMQYVQVRCDGHMIHAQLKYDIMCMITT